MVNLEGSNYIDTVHFYVEPEHYTCKDSVADKNKILGATYMKYPNGKIKFNVSGKLFSTPSSLGYITQENYINIIAKLEKAFNISIDKYYFRYEMLLCRVDVVKDYFLSYNPKYYISELRRCFNYFSDKLSVYKYESCTYDNGLACIPKTQEKIKLSCYYKGYELSKARNREYTSMFTYDFMELMQYCLRTELQLKSFSAINKYFDSTNFFVGNTFEGVFNQTKDIIKIELLSYVLNYLCDKEAQL